MNNLTLTVRDTLNQLLQTYNKPNTDQQFRKKAVEDIKTRMVAYLQTLQINTSLLDPALNQQMLRSHVYWSLQQTLLMAFSKDQPIKSGVFTTKSFIQRKLEQVLDLANTDGTSTLVNIAFFPKNIKQSLQWVQDRQTVFGTQALIKILEIYKLVEGTGQNQAFLKHIAAQLAPQLANTQFQPSMKQLESFQIKVRVLIMRMEDQLSRARDSQKRKIQDKYTNLIKKAKNTFFKITDQLDQRQLIDQKMRWVQSKLKKYNKSLYTRNQPLTIQQQKQILQQQWQKQHLKLDKKWYDYQQSKQKTIQRLTQYQQYMKKVLKKEGVRTKSTQSRQQSYKLALSKVFKNKVIQKDVQKFNFPQIKLLNKYIDVLQGKQRQGDVLANIKINFPKEWYNSLKAIIQSTRYERGFTVTDVQKLAIQQMNRKIAIQTFSKQPQNISQISMNTEDNQKYLVQQYQKKKAKLYQQLRKQKLPVDIARLALYDVPKHVRDLQKDLTISQDKILFTHAQFSKSQNDLFQRRRQKILKNRERDILYAQANIKNLDIIPQQQIARNLDLIDKQEEQYQKYYQTLLQYTPYRQANLMKTLAAGGFIDQGYMSKVSQNLSKMDQLISYQPIFSQGHPDQIWDEKFGVHQDLLDKIDQKPLQHMYIFDAQGAHWLTGIWNKQLNQFLVWNSINKKAPDWDGKSQVWKYQLDKKTQTWQYRDHQSSKQYKKIIQQSNQYGIAKGLTKLVWKYLPQTTLFYQKVLQQKQNQCGAIVSIIPYYGLQRTKNLVDLGIIRDKFIEILTQGKLWKAPQRQFLIWAQQKGYFSTANLKNQFQKYQQKSKMLKNFQHWIQKQGQDPKRLQKLWQAAQQTRLQKISIHQAIQRATLKAEAQHLQFQQLRNRIRGIDQNSKQITKKIHTLQQISGMSQQASDQRIGLMRQRNQLATQILVQQQHMRQKKQIIDQQWQKKRLLSIIAGEQMQKLSRQNQQMKKRSQQAMNYAQSQHQKFQNIKKNLALKEKQILFYQNLIQQNPGLDAQANQAKIDRIVAQIEAGTQDLIQRKAKIQKFMQVSRRARDISKGIKTLKQQTQQAAKQDQIVRLQNLNKTLEQQSQKNQQQWINQFNKIKNLQITDLNRFNQTLRIKQRQQQKIANSISANLITIKNLTQRLQKAQKLQQSTNKQLEIYKTDKNFKQLQIKSYQDKIANLQQVNQHRAQDHKQFEKKYQNKIMQLQNYNHQLISQMANQNQLIQYLKTLNQQLKANISNVQAQSQTRINIVQRQTFKSQQQRRKEITQINQWYAQQLHQFQVKKQQQIKLAKQVAENAIYSQLSNISTYKSQIQRLKQTLLVVATQDKNQIQLLKSSLNQSTTKLQLVKKQKNDLERLINQKQNQKRTLSQKYYEQANLVGDQFKIKQAQITKMSQQLKKVIAHTEALKTQLQNKKKSQSKLIQQRNNKIHQNQILIARQTQNAKKMQMYLQKLKQQNQKQNLQNLKKMKQGFQNQKIQLKNRIQFNKSEIQKLNRQKQEIQSKSSVLSSSHTKIIQQQAKKIKQLQQKLKLSVKSSNSLLKNLKDKQQEIENQKKRQLKFKQQIASKQTIINQLQSQKNLTNQQLLKKAKQVASYKQTISSLKQNLNQKQQQVTKIVQKQQDQRKQLLAKASQIASLQKNLIEKGELLVASQKSKQEIQKEIQAKSRQIQKFKQKIVNQQAQINVLKQQQRSTSDKLNQKIQGYQNFKNAATKIRDKQTAQNKQLKQTYQAQITNMKKNQTQIVKLLNMRQVSFQKQKQGLNQKLLQNARELVQINRKSQLNQNNLKQKLKFFQSLNQKTNQKVVSIQKEKAQRQQQIRDNHMMIDQKQQIILGLQKAIQISKEQGIQSQKKIEKLKNQLTQNANIKIKQFQGRVEVLSQQKQKIEKQLIFSQRIVLKQKQQRKIIQQKLEIQQKNVENLKNKIQITKKQLQNDYQLINKITVEKLKQQLQKSYNKLKQSKQTQIQGLEEKLQKAEQRQVQLQKQLDQRIQIFQQQQQSSSMQIQRLNDQMQELEQALKQAKKIKDVRARLQITSTINQKINEVKEKIQQKGPMISLQDNVITLLGQPLKEILKKKKKQQIALFPQLHTQIPQNAQKIKTFAPKQQVQTQIQSILNQAQKIKSVIKIQQDLLNKTRHQLVNLYEKKLKTIPSTQQMTNIQARQAVVNQIKNIVGVKSKARISWILNKRLAELLDKKRSIMAISAINDQTLLGPTLTALLHQMTDKYDSVLMKGLLFGLFQRFLHHYKYWRGKIIHKRNFKIKVNQMWNQLAQQVFRTLSQIFEHISKKKFIDGWIKRGQYILPLLEQFDTSPILRKAKMIKKKSLQQLQWFNINIQPFVSVQQKLLYQLTNQALPTRAIPLHIQLDSQTGRNLQSAQNDILIDLVSRILGNLRVQANQIQALIRKLGNQKARNFWTQNSDLHFQIQFQLQPTEGFSVFIPITISVYQTVFQIMQKLRRAINRVIINAPQYSSYMDWFVKNLKFKGKVRFAQLVQKLRLIDPKTAQKLQQFITLKARKNPKQIWLAQYKDFYDKEQSCWQNVINFLNNKFDTQFEACQYGNVRAIKQYVKDIPVGLIIGKKIIKQGQISVVVLNSENIQGKMRIRDHIFITGPTQSYNKHSTSYSDIKVMRIPTYTGKQRKIHNIYLDIQCFADTKSFSRDRANIQRVYLIGIVVKKRFQQEYFKQWHIGDCLYIEQSWQRQLMYQEFCKEFMQIVESQQGIWNIWAYNGINYDYQYILPQLLSKYLGRVRLLGDSCSPKAYIYQMNEKTTLRFLDTKTIITAGSLDKNSKKYNKKWKKEKIDIHLITNLQEFLDNKDKIINYNKLDCLSMMQLLQNHYQYLWKYIEKCSQQLNRRNLVSQNAFMLKWTIPSMAYYLFSTVFLSNNVHPDNQLLQTHRNNYFGGCTQVWKHKTQQKLYQLDINAQYPSIMFYGSHPVYYVGHKIISIFQLSQQKQKIIRGQRDNFFYKITSFNLRNGATTIGVSTGTSLIYPQQYNCRNCPQKWMWGIQMRPHLKFNKNTFQFYEYHQYTQNNPLTGQKWLSFRNYVQKAYNYRLQAKQSKNQLMDNIGKLFQNSLYGKLAQKQFQALQMSWQQKYVYQPSKEQQQQQKFHVGNFVRLASFITAGARARLTRYIYKIGVRNVWYMDTDSLYTNIKGYKKMLQIQQIDGKVLGKMKLQRVLKSAFFIAKKFYVAEVDFQGMMQNKLLDQEQVQQLSKKYQNHQGFWTLKSKGINTNQQQVKICQLYFRCLQLYPIAIVVWQNSPSTSKVFTIMFFQSIMWQKQKKQEYGVKRMKIMKRANFIFQRRPLLNGDSEPFTLSQLIQLPKKKTKINKDILGCLTSQELLRLSACID